MKGASHKSVGKEQKELKVKGYRVSFSCDKKILKFIVVITA